MVLNIENIYKYFNGELLLNDISLTIEDREAVGLIGSNGCGKTTLLNIITGSEGFDRTPDGITTDTYEEGMMVKLEGRKHWPD